MRWLALALGGGLGCLGCGGEAAPEPVCTATADTLARSASILDERGLPRTAWTWDVRGTVTQTIYAYDDAGRIVEQRVDRGSAAPTPAGGEQEPDGIAEEVTAIVYAGGTAEVIATDLRTSRSGRIAWYVFDELGRPTRVDEQQASVTATRTYRYDGEGRVVFVDEQIPQVTSPVAQQRAYTYGADGRPASLRATSDGSTVAYRFRYEDAPGRVAVTRFHEDIPSNATTSVYEHDAAGRLVRVRGGATVDRDLDIAYAGDGAVAILLGNGTLHTYSAACGVRLEVPRGPEAPRGPEPSGHFTVPVVRTPF
jgi:hypothetical protein